MIASGERRIICSTNYQVAQTHIDAHGFKIQRRVYLKFLPKFQGGSRLTGKIARGVPLFRILLHLY